MKLYFANHRFSRQSSNTRNPREKRNCKSPGQELEFRNIDWKSRTYGRLVSCKLNRALLPLRSLLSSKYVTVYVIHHFLPKIYQKVTGSIQKGNQNDF